MKLAIGTVQFGLQYGVSNTTGIPNDNQLTEIFEIANKNNITILDTAMAYGNAESRISFVAKKFNIVTKFNNVKTREELGNALSNSLNNLQLDSVYGYMAHNFQLLNENPDFWTVLQEEKEKGRVKKIGYSLYEPSQLEQLLEKEMVPDLVQLPYSIFDRKFENYFKLLKEMNTEIHIRSAFLQGLYFMNPPALPEKLKPLSGALTELKLFCETSGKAVADIALNFVYSNPFIDKVVIGVVNAEQLQENSNSVLSWNANEDFFDSIKNIAIKEKELLNPANW